MSGNQFKTVDQLTAYADAQYQTIIELSKKIQVLEEKNAHLELVVAGSTSLVIPSESILSPNVPKEQLIAEIQIARLKQHSDERELTLEETKKVSEFAKILAGFRADSSDKPKDIEVKAMSHEDLLKAIDVSSE